MKLPWWVNGLFDRLYWIPPVLTVFVILVDILVPGYAVTGLHGLTPKNTILRDLSQTGTAIVNEPIQMIHEDIRLAAKENPAKELSDSLVIKDPSPGCTHLAIITKSAQWINNRRLGNLQILDQNSFSCSAKTALFIARSREESVLAVATMSANDEWLTYCRTHGFRVKNNQTTQDRLQSVNWISSNEKKYQTSTVTVPTFDQGRYSQPVAMVVFLDLPLEQKYRVVENGKTYSKFSLPLSPAGIFPVLGTAVLFMVLAEVSAVGMTKTSKWAVNRDISVSRGVTILLVCCLLLLVATICVCYSVAAVKTLALSENGGGTFFLNIVISG